MIRNVIEKKIVQIYFLQQRILSNMSIVLREILSFLCYSSFHRYFYRIHFSRVHYITCQLTILSIFYNR